MIEGESNSVQYRETQPHLLRDNLADLSVIFTIAGGWGTWLSNHVVPSQFVNTSPSPPPPQKNK